MQVIRKLALQHVLVLECELRSPFDFHFHFRKRHCGVRVLVSATLEVDGEDGLLLNFRQVEDGVDDLHRSVECLGHCQLDALHPVLPLRTQQRCRQVFETFVLSPFSLDLLTCQGASLETNDDAIV